MIIKIIEINNLQTVTRLVRNYFLVFSLGLISICYGQGTWERMEIAVSVNLNDIHFIDSITGWCVGDSGIIIHTYDGGNSWEIQQSNTTNNIKTVFFISNDIGFASAHNFTILPYGTDLLSTNDGGETWTVSRYPEDNIFITSIYYHDSLNGWMGGTPHAIVNTIDGGQTWNQASIDTSTLAFFPVLNITFYNQKYGYASGGIFDIAGVIWITDNSGVDWKAISTDYAPADEVHGIYPFDSLRIIGSGGDPDFGYGAGFMNTYDGGFSWEYDEIGVQGIAYDIDFVDSMEGWAPLGPERSFVFTMDAGLTWTSTPTPDNTSIFKVDFPDESHGYAIGRDGAFLAFNPSIPVGVGNLLSDNKKITLSQNFPNPFSQNTTIKIRVPKNINSIKLPVLHFYDSNGKLLLEKEPNFISGDEYGFTIDGSNMANGIYNYNISTYYGLSETKKAVLFR